MCFRGFFSGVPGGVKVCDRVVEPESVENRLLGGVWALVRFGCDWWSSSSSVAAGRGGSACWHRLALALASSHMPCLRSPRPPL